MDLTNVYEYNIYFSFSELTPYTTVQPKLFKQKVKVKWLVLLIYIFSMSLVQIVAWTLIILTEPFIFSPSRQILGQCLKLDHDCFLLYPFQFIIH